MYQKKNSFITVIIILILIAGLGIISFSDVDIPYLGWVEKGIFNLLSPVVEVGTGFYNSVSNYWEGLTNSVRLVKENGELKANLSHYEVQKHLMNYLINENQRLRNLLSFKENFLFKSVGARIIGYSSTHWENRLLIDRGTRDGISEKMPVISYHGALVGRVIYAGAYSSQVLMINDPEYVVGGIVQRTGSRAIGLVKGQLNNPGRNVMDNISWNTGSPEGDIKEGDIIVTSGLSNLYPKGLPIGKVITVDKDNYGLSQKAEIELFLNMQTVEEVLVITEF